MVTLVSPPQPFTPDIATAAGSMRLLSKTGGTVGVAEMMNETVDAGSCEARGNSSADTGVGAVTSACARSEADVNPHCLLALSSSTTPANCRRLPLCNYPT